MTQTQTQTRPAGSCTCWKCGGSGKYYSGGAVVNGKYTGNVGMCYPCRGKGWQTTADRRRTNYYYNFVYTARM